MIYFVKDTVSQAIKIGYSKKPKDRLGGLQTGNPHKLVLLGTVAGMANDEASFHGKFAQHRLEGEWFKGEIIEEVLDIIATHTKQRLEIRRITVTETTDGGDKADGGPVPDVAGEATAGEKGAMDSDSGIQGVCRIPGLTMKSFSLTLTERPHENRTPLTTCGVQIKYLLAFERDFTVDDAGRTDLTNLKNALLPSQRMKHTFYDEDNAVIPFSLPPAQAGNCYHVVGGQEAITGAKGDAFRVLVAFERQLNPNAHSMIKDVFTGDNYTGQHPLRKAKRMVVSLR